MPRRLPPITVELMNLPSDETFEDARPALLELLRSAERRYNATRSYVYARPALTREPEKYAATHKMYLKLRQELPRLAPQHALVLAKAETRPTRPITERRARYEERAQAHGKGHGGRTPWLER